MPKSKKNNNKQHHVQAAFYKKEGSDLSLVNLVSVLQIVLATITWVDWRLLRKEPIMAGSKRGYGANNKSWKEEAMNAHRANGIKQQALTTTLLVALILQAAAGFVMPNSAQAINKTAQITNQSDIATDTVQSVAANMKTIADISAISADVDDTAGSSEQSPGYSTYSEEMYTVTFDSAGGSLVASITVSAGSTIPKPVDPVRPPSDNLVFDLWAVASPTDPNLLVPWDLATDTVESDITLHAIWTPIKWASRPFFIDFDSQGGSAVDRIVVLTAGSHLDKPTDPTKEGYVFAGWYKDIAFTMPWDFATDVVEDDMTLYAKWIAVEKPPVISTTTTSTAITKSIPQTGDDLASWRAVLFFPAISVLCVGLAIVKKRRAARG